ncbi:sensor histidine kinase [Actinomadura latina]|uniref:histidine kinase n=1 Tax=Actinomadura latina TaxID=163603 RepID=A0A846Z5I8_9ACTN|nr:HAMP domain-containing sensor histidine kinase [Actinomadura latina]NKZ05925.1 HAMP domain-containing histidine kinase [Actinomadura latina]
MTLKELTALACLPVAAVAAAAVVLLLADTSTGVVATVMALLAAAVAALTWWRVRRAVSRTLRPLERLRAELITAAEAGPGSRVGVPATGDDVERLAGRVNLLLDRLEVSAAQRRAFIADASHELRTPLAGLRTRIELAIDDPEDGDLDDNLRHALDDVERLHRIVEDLFVLARLDSGDLPERRRLDLGALVESEVAERISSVPVDVKAEPEIMVMGNRSRLGRVLFNLLSNAERYAVAHIEVRVRAAGEEAVVEVHDDGPGIPPDARDRVFERFARLDAARSRDKGGSGLGLPIARQIAIAHGGTLYVANGTYGARLVLRLPLAR